MKRSAILSLMFIAGLLAVPGVLNAQVEKRVEVSKAYVPSVEHATKLAVRPNMVDTAAIQPEIDYSITPLTLETQLATRPIRPATITYWEFDRPLPFYLKAGAGYPLNSALDLYVSTQNPDIGYALGYGLMGLTGLPILLALAFFIVGIAKGSVLNTCTILVSGNSADRTRGMNTMHACYACGALLCPFLISAAARVSTTLAVLALAALGLVLWLVYLFTPMAGRAKAKEAVTDWSFLRSSRFWLLTGLLFCQNAAEQSVVGWMVTYFKDSGIIAGTLAAYTVTVMWGATLIGRLLIAFVFPLKQPRKAMVFMAVFCTAFYFAMMQTHSQLPAILLLFAFAFSMAGMNPTAVASAGKMTTVTSMGIMLPVASSGAILMPWVIGKVAESAGLAVGMATNIVPCVGLIIFAILVSRMREE